MIFADLPRTSVIISVALWVGRVHSQGHGVAKQAFDRIGVEQSTRPPRHFEEHRVESFLEDISDVLSRGLVLGVIAAAVRLALCGSS